MFREDGLTPAQKACLGVLAPALFFLPIVLGLAATQSTIGLAELLMVRFDDGLVRLFWGLLLVSLFALFGLVATTISRRRTAARRMQPQGHIY